MSNQGGSSELPEGQQPVSLPLCPNLRPTFREWYAVEGYCVLDRACGRLMIPSLHEFEAYCLTQHFHRCPWFGGTQDGAGAVTSPRSRPPVRMGRWLSPGARWAREI